MSDFRPRGGNIPGLSRAVRCAIYERDEWKCTYCGVAVILKQHVSVDAAATIDHVIPFLAGGITYQTNLVCACARCNRNKNDSTDLLYVELAKHNVSRAIDLHRGRILAREFYPNKRKKRR